MNDETIILQFSTGC